MESEIPVVTSSSVEVKYLSAGTLLKLIFIGQTVFFTLFVIAGTILSGFHLSFGINGEKPLETEGVMALIFSPLLGICLGVASSLLTFVTVFLGLWLYSWFRTIRITYVPVGK